MPITIEKAAIILDDIIHSLDRPARHHTIIHKLAMEGYPIPIQGEQGFLTSEGEFVDRLTGAAIALNSGQIIALHWPPYLYSEDLW